MLPDDGIVWTISNPENRAAAPAALEAMVYGAHVLLTKGDNAYTGSMRTPLTKQNDGTWLVSLPGGVSSRLERTDSALVLHLPSGLKTTLLKKSGDPVAAFGAGRTATWARYELSDVAAVSSWQAPPQLDDEAVALTWHKVARVPFDAAAVATRSRSLQELPAFDRADSTRAWAQRLEQRLATMSADATFRVRVNDNVSEYDHAQQRFSVHFFEPGTYLPLQVFGEEYRVVFSNADAARFIGMPKDAARSFDEDLRSQGRGVLTDIAFRVTGQGDPSGAVTGARVIRAELSEVHLRDREEHELFSPALSASTPAAREPTDFDIASADVAGLRVGITGELFARAAARLYGKTERRANARGGYAAVSGIIVVNEMGCSSIPGRGRVRAGIICATAFVDKDDIVRSIRIERVFPFISSETFRQLFVQRFGTVADAAQRSGYTLAWGPVTDSMVAYDRSGPRNALTATWNEDEDMMSRSLNAAPRVRITLQLTDAAWISTQPR